MAPGELLAGSGLLAFFVVMLLKEIGVPIPIPSDLIMITAGVQLAAQAFGPLELVIVAELAILIGCSIHFFLARAAGRRLVYRLGRFVGLTESRLDRATSVLRTRGPLAIILALNVPAARAGVVAAAGVAGFTYRAFAPAMVAGNSVFYGWHIALGFLVGPAALALLQQANASLVAVFAALAMLGLLAWLILKRRGSRDAAAGNTLDRLHTWTEAACPGCLAMTALGVRMPGLEVNEEH
jgi:membrane protein DedA with SNARE-associated domain